MLETVQIALDRITEQTGIIIVTAGGQDVDYLTGKFDGLASKITRRSLASYRRGYDEVKTILRLAIGVEMFDPIPTNPLNLTNGDILLAVAQTENPAQESSHEFLKALGGDADTYIALLGMSGGSLYGLPLGKSPFIAEFRPSWDVEQLCAEIEAGFWRVVKGKDSEFKNEVLRRLAAFESSLDVLDSTDASTAGNSD